MTDSQSDPHLYLSQFDCPHLIDFRSRHGSKPFRLLQQCIRVKPPGRASIRRDPNELPRCLMCTTNPPPSPRLYACISCAAVSCRLHVVEHSKDQSSDHVIAVDVDRAELFCCACEDQVYDADFDAAVVLAQTAASTLGGGSARAPLPPENLRKRRRVDYRPWTPDMNEQVVIESNAIPLPIVMDNGASSDIPWGLKGLNNLGNTCFMNSVLQALLHTPPFRNYFLSDRHNRYFCQQKNRGIKNEVNNKNLRLCLACDMDAMFSAVFSGDRTSYSPAKFLHSWWQHAANLASYEQQDAHEFFISMLDAIHEKVEKDKRKPHIQEPSV